MWNSEGFFFVQPQHCKSSRCVDNHGGVENIETGAGVYDVEFVEVAKKFLFLITEPLLSDHSPIHSR